MITKGQQIAIKPEWQDAGDEDYTFSAMEEPHPVTGYFKVRVTPNTPDANFSPWTVMKMHVSQVEDQA